MIALQISVLIYFKLASSLHWGTTTPFSFTADHIHLYKQTPKLSSGLMLSQFSLSNSSKYVPKKAFVVFHCRLRKRRRYKIESITQYYCTFVSMLIWGGGMLLLRCVAKESQFIPGIPFYFGLASISNLMAHQTPCYSRPARPSEYFKELCLAPLSGITRCS